MTAGHAAEPGRSPRPLAAQADEHMLTDRTGMDTCVRYLVNKQEYQRYDMALAAGGRSRRGLWKAHADT
jgi:hypothetical protein